MATAQRLARHSDPRLTSNVYTHIDEATKADAIASLEGLRARKQDEQATEAVVAPKVALTDAKQGQDGAPVASEGEDGAPEVPFPKSFSEETLAAFLQLLTELEKYTPEDSNL